MSFAPLPATACWEHRAARSGFEVAYFQTAPGGWRMDGTTAAVEDGQTWIVSYSIRLDAAWITREARVTARTASGPRETLLACDGEGRWHVDGRVATHLDGCLDVDLESSALTNTLPVHRLGLATGAHALTPAAYVRAPGLHAERLEQSYARLPDEAGHQHYGMPLPLSASPALWSTTRVAWSWTIRASQSGSADPPADLIRPACPVFVNAACLHWRCARGECHYRAEHDKAPSMYEMEGAVPGSVALGSPVARQTRRHAPPAGPGYPRDVPVSRYFPRPGVAPRTVPVSNGESISTAFPAVAQESAGIHFEFFSRPHGIHRTPAVIRTLRRLSTGLCTAHPQATQRNSLSTNIAVAKCNRPVFPSDFR